MKINLPILVCSCTTALVGYGCARGDLPKQEASPVEVEEDSIFHNLREVHANDWTIQAWTDGSGFSPGYPIGVGVRVNHDQLPPDSLIPPTLVFRLVGVTNDFCVVSEVKPVWRTMGGHSRKTILFMNDNNEFEQKPAMVGGLEYVNDDVFSTDRRIGPGARILDEGKYLLEIQLICKEGRIALPKMALKVFSKRPR
jgi:hypothetical protein